MNAKETVSTYPIFEVSLLCLAFAYLWMIDAQSSTCANDRAAHEGSHQEHGEIDQKPR